MKVIKKKTWIAYEIFLDIVKATNKMFNTELELWEENDPTAAELSVKSLK